KYALSYYWNWIGSDREHAVLRLTLVLSNVASAIAFADSDTWARNVEKHGLPSVTSEHVRFPEEGQPGIELPWNAQGAEWRFVAGLIGLAFGLPPESFEPMLDEVEHPRR
ncbi:MAG TPA: hypothetical protein VFP05_02680, partial [Thermomicrobiales bacterium]|nr:hypothetical protein [Thermomicrobiales bacterium]